MQPAAPSPGGPAAPAEPPAVAGVPRLFVGQVPATCTEEDLMPVFAGYGEIEKVSLVRGPDNKSRGCCMVQFRRWADAERAMRAVNGTCPLEDGKGRPLVCHFANPRRTPAGGQATESAIAPRKLFVGQIPKTCSEADVLELFAPFGEVESVNILKSKGVHAGCAFVQYSTWASCEAAIEALHDKHTMGGAEHALVVKFADAKKDTQGLMGPKRGLGMVGLAGFGMHPALLGSHPGSYGDMGLAPGMGHMGMPGMPGGLGGMNGLLAGGGLGPGGLGHMGLPSGLVGGKPLGLGSHDGGSSDNLLASDSDGPSSLAPLPGSVPSNLGMGEHHGLHHGLPSSGSMGNLAAMQAGLHLPGMPAPHSLVGSSGDLHPMGMHAPHQQAAMMMAAAHAAHSGGSSPGGPPQLGRGGAVKLGRGVADPAAYQHKLFIGQVPFDAIEEQLWQLFCPAGDILELAILRSQGRSKGCAFLTYASRQQAEAAIQAFNGRQVSPSKRLVVKFADQKA